MSTSPKLWLKGEKTLRVDNIDIKKDDWFIANIQQTGNLIQITLWYIKHMYIDEYTYIMYVIKYVYGTTPRDLIIGIVYFPIHQDSIYQNYA